jgi:hypothetical protein
MTRRLLLALGGLIVLLMAAGAVSFVRYARSHAPDPKLVAVAPIDIFAPGDELARWRVRLAQALTERLSVTPLAAVPQTVVAQTWRAAERPEIAAVELARRTGAAVAIYARVDPIEPGDSVRVNLIAADAVTTRILFGVVLRWPSADPDGLAAQLAEHVRHNHPVTRAAGPGRPPDPPR